MIVTSRESESNVKLVLRAIETVFDKHDVNAIDPTPPDSNSTATEPVRGHGIASR